MVDEDLLQLLAILTGLRLTNAAVMSLVTETVMVVIETDARCHPWEVHPMTDAHHLPLTTHHRVRDLTTAEGLLLQALWVTPSKFVFLSHQSGPVSVSCGIAVRCQNLVVKCKFFPLQWSI